MKKLISLVLVVLMLFSFAGCSVTIGGKTIGIVDSDTTAAVTETAAAETAVATTATTTTAVPTTVTTTAVSTTLEPLSHRWQYSCNFTDFYLWYNLELSGDGTFIRRAFYSDSDSSSYSSNIEEIEGTWTYADGVLTLKFNDSQDQSLVNKEFGVRGKDYNREDLHLGIDDQQWTYTGNYLKNGNDYMRK